jgi:hypothetical protein
VRTAVHRRNGPPIAWEAGDFWPKKPGRKIWLEKEDWPKKRPRRRAFGSFGLQTSLLRARRPLLLFKLLAQPVSALLKVRLEVPLRLPTLLKVLLGLLLLLLEHLWVHQRTVVRLPEAVARRIGQRQRRGDLVGGKVDGLDERAAGRREELASSLANYRRHTS